ncbi:hypothetical protein ABEB36_006464 [Hypothenemus hampei]|uniref:Uncharacterized protein n=1 Tax=Hypothenemus hampei TaxID=57062 RepID=A0ABD1EUI4_HYPHA
MAEDNFAGFNDHINNLKSTDEQKALLQELMKTLQNMPGVPDEQKESMLKNALEGNEDAMQAMAGSAGQNTGLPMEEAGNLNAELAILLSLITVLALILGFIVFKLYNNRTRRQRIKEEKQIRKELKKQN